MVPLSPWSTESPHIQINTCIWTAITASLTNTASIIHSHIETSMFFPANSYWNKKTNISIQYSASALNLTGLSTGSNPNWTSNSVTSNGTTIQISTATQIRTTICLQWSHTPKISVRVSETFVGMQEYKFTSRVPIQLRNFL